MEILFAETRYKKPISREFMKKIREAIEPYKKINLVASVQYLNQLEQIRKEIKDKEFILLKSNYRALYPGQILGCDVLAAGCEDCDVILSLTQGMFHVLGILVKYDKPVINVDVENENIEFLSPDNFYKKRIMQGIGLALTAKKVMFVASIKLIQYYPFDKLKEFFIKRGVETYTVVFDDVDFKTLNEFRDIDIFINTACQRIAMDDMNKIEKPIINAEDLEDYLTKNKMLG